MKYVSSLFITLAAALGLSAVVTAPLTVRASEGSSVQDASWATEAQQAIPKGQEAIINAQENGQGLSFVEVSDVQVVQLLPDDLQGSTHQKWVVKLANGRTVLSVYNTDICERVPLKVGDTLKMGGQYIWQKSGGLIHWLHQDPEHRRPDGYVELNGKRYGTVDPEALKREQETQSRRSNPH